MFSQMKSSESRQTCQCLHIAARSRIVQIRRGSLHSTGFLDRDDRFEEKDDCGNLTTQPKWGMKNVTEKETWCGEAGGLRTFNWVAAWVAQRCRHLIKIHIEIILGVPHFYQMTARGGNFEAQGGTSFCKVTMFQDVGKNLWTWTSCWGKCAVCEVAGADWG